MSVLFFLCMSANIDQRLYGAGERGPADLGGGPDTGCRAVSAKAEGATEVFGFDLTPQRREYATAKLGIATFDPRAELEAFPARPKSPALGCTIDCVGAKSSVEWAMDHTKETVALFGVPALRPLPSRLPPLGIPAAME